MSDSNLKFSELTDKEVHKMAADLASGRIFGMYINDNRLRLSFMVTMFMGRDMTKELFNNDVIFIYEYLDKSGPGSVNGLPTFFSARYLTANDYRKVMNKFCEIFPYINPDKELPDIDKINDTIDQVSRFVKFTARTWDEECEKLDKRQRHENAINKLRNCYKEFDNKVMQIFNEFVHQEIT